MDPERVVLPGFARLAPAASRPGRAPRQESAGAGRTASWTSFNMPASVTLGSATDSFGYDDAHNRIQQVTPLQVAQRRGETIVAGAMRWAAIQAVAAAMPNSGMMPGNAVLDLVRRQDRRPGAEATAIIEAANAVQLLTAAEPMSTEIGSPKSVKQQ